MKLTKPQQSQLDYIARCLTIGDGEQQQVFESSDEFWSKESWDVISLLDLNASRRLDRLVGEWFRQPTYVDGGGHARHDIEADMLKLIAPHVTSPREFKLNYDKWDKLLWRRRSK